VFSKPRIARTIKPEKSAGAAYHDQYCRYASIYPSIKGI
jgi:hypothetical protein